MERSEFVQKYPEEAAEQDKAGNRGILRLIAIITLGTAFTIGTAKYCKDEEFQTKVNDLVEKINYKALRLFG